VAFRRQAKATNMPMKRERAVRSAAIILGILALSVGGASLPAQGQVPYKSYCLESRAQQGESSLDPLRLRATPGLADRPRGNWGGSKCGLAGAHELRVVWKTAAGVDREERVDLKALLPRSIDTSRHQGEVYMKDPLVTEPTLRVDVQDRELQVTFEAEVWYVRERRPDGVRPHYAVKLTTALYRSNENRPR
jgi:hypothetical protein